MPKIRGNPSEKWVRRASQAGQDYADGINNPSTSWQAATTAAAANHAAGVQQAITEKRFERGVAKAGDRKWQEKALSKGTVRFGPGVADAQQTYHEAVAPFLATIESTKLTPRGPKGDPNNYKRVMEIGEALRKKKKSL